MRNAEIVLTNYGFIYGPAIITRIADSSWGCVLEISGVRQRVEIRVTPSGRIRVGQIITRKEAQQWATT